MTQQYDPNYYIDPNGEKINPGDLVCITAYGTANPTNGSFRFGVAEKFRPGNTKWNEHDLRIFIRCLTFNTSEQTFGDKHGTWICQHNQRVFKITGDKLEVVSNMVGALAKMMAGKKC